VLSSGCEQTIAVGYLAKKFYEAIRIAHAHPLLPASITEQHAEACLYRNERRGERGSMRAEDALEISSGSAFRRHFSPRTQLNLRRRALRDVRRQATVSIRNRRITPLAPPRSVTGASRIIQQRCSAIVARCRLRIRASSARNVAFPSNRATDRGTIHVRYATRPVARSIYVKFRVHAPRDWRHCC